MSHITLIKFREGILQEILPYFSTLQLKNIDLGMHFFTDVDVTQSGKYSIAQIDSFLVLSLCRYVLSVFINAAVTETRICCQTAVNHTRTLILSRRVLLSPIHQIYNQLPII